MKYLLVFALLSAIVLGVSPLVIGAKIEQGIETQLLLNTDIPGYRLSLENYDRGYLSSTVLFRVAFDQEALGLPAADDASRVDLPFFFRDGLTLEWQIGHGPLLHQQGLAIGSMEVSLLIDATQFPALTGLLAQTDADYLLHSYTRLDFDGQGWSDIHMPALDTTLMLDGQPLAITFSGTQGHYQIERFGRISAGSNQIEQLRLQTGPAVFEMTDTTLSSTVEIQDDLLLANQRLALDIASLSYRLPGWEVQLDDIALVAQVDDGESPGSRHSYQQLALGRLQTPAWTLEDAGVVLEFGNISNALILDYYRFSSHAAELENVDPETESAHDALLEFLAPRLAEALHHGPWIKISDLGFNWQGQRLDASLSLEFEQPQLLSATPGLPELALWARQSLILDTFLQADKSLLESIARAQARSRMMSFITTDSGNAMATEEIEAQSFLQARGLLEELTAAGYLLENVDAYVASLKLHGGRMDINGVALPFPSL